jgi:hypothetical protein
MILQMPQGISGIVLGQEIETPVVPYRKFKVFSPKTALEYCTNTLSYFNMQAYCEAAGVKPTAAQLTACESDQRCKALTTLFRNKNTYINSTYYEKQKNTLKEVDSFPTTEKTSEDMPPTPCPFIPMVGLLAFEYGKKWSDLVEHVKSYNSRHPESRRTLATLNTFIDNPSNFIISWG